jgi:hypothetical protein
VPARVHLLSGLDPQARTATCAHCGPVPVKRCGVRPNGTVKWRCVIAARPHRRGGGAESKRLRRRRYRKLVGESCERCGFVAEDPCQLDVHHRDGDHGNDEPSNLVTLCANCHRLLHFAKA